MANCLKIASSFCHRHYLPHLILAAAFCLFADVFVSLRNLEIYQSARVLEMYAVWIGIILLTPLFMPEQNEQIRQLLQTKKAPMWISHIIRLVVAVIALIIASLFFMVALEAGGSEILFGKMYLGLLSETLFLGSIGFFTSAITNQVIIGYMAPIIYFVINIGERDLFGKFGMFQMTFHGTYDFWYWMLAGAVLFLVSGICLRIYIK